MEGTAVVHIGHVAGIAHGDPLRVGGAPGHLAAPVRRGEFSGKLGAAAHMQGNIGDRLAVGVLQHDAGQDRRNGIRRRGGLHGIHRGGGLAHVRGGYDIRPLAGGGHGRGGIRLGFFGGVELGIDEREHDDQRRHNNDQRTQEGDQTGPVDRGQVEPAALLGSQPLAALGTGGVVLLLRLIVKSVLPAENIAVVQLLLFSAPGTGGRRGFIAGGGTLGIVALSAEGAAPVGGAVVLAAGGAVDQGVTGRLRRHIGIPPWSGKLEPCQSSLSYTFCVHSSILLLCNPAVFCPCGPG